MDKQLLINAFEGKAFGGYGQQVATAGALSQVQLLNPAGSGVVAVVDYLGARTNAAVTGVVGIYNTPLTNGSTHVTNLLLGGSAPVCLVRYGTSGGSLFTTGIVMFEVPTADFVLPFGDRTPGIILEPGYGLMVELQSYNITLTASFRWREF